MINNSMNYNMMNNNQNDKFIYITPFLDEVKRVIDNCPNRYFEQPDEKKGKGSKLTEKSVNNI